MDTYTNAQRHRVMHTQTESQAHTHQGTVSTVCGLGDIFLFLPFRTEATLSSVLYVPLQAVGQGFFHDHPASPCVLQKLEV